MENKFKIGLCQMMVSTSKKDNVEKARLFINEAVSKGADMVALSEMWNSPYSNKFFGKFAEEEGGETFQFLSQMAKDNNIYLIGGSIPEREIIDGEEKIFNTSYTFDREGKLIGKHRKVHLFDIDIKGKISFKESDTLSPGTTIETIDTEYGKIAVGICFDVRFPEMFRKLTLEGAKLVVLPAAFNINTGPSHWFLSMRARAVDNQIYFAAVSPARSKMGFEAFAHSCLVDPWGEIKLDLEIEEGVQVGDVDLNYVDSIREQLPLLSARKEELY